MPKDKILCYQKSMNLSSSKNNLTLPAEKALKTNYDSSTYCSWCPLNGLKGPGKKEIKGKNEYT